MIPLCKIRPIMLIAPVLLIGGCGEDAAAPDEDIERTASGEVLEGSASDAMITADGLQSQPPLVRVLPQEEEQEDGVTIIAAGQERESALSLPSVAVPAAPETVASPPSGAAPAE